MKPLFKGRGYVATSDFVPFFWGPLRTQGYVAILLNSRPPRRHGSSNHFKGFRSVNTSTPSRRQAWFGLGGAPLPTVAGNWVCYALKQKYHQPPPPAPWFKISFTPTNMPQNDPCDEAVILSHICWGPGASTPSGHPPDPPDPPPPLKWHESGRGSVYGPLLRPPCPLPT